jgi:hypothetical protein
MDSWFDMPKLLALILTEGRERFNMESKQTITCLGLGVVLLLEMLGYLLGSPGWFSLLYLIPIAAVTWRVGLLQGVLIAVLSTLPYVVSDSISAAVSSRSIAAYWNSAARLEFFFIFILVLAISKLKRKRLQEKLAESTLALETELEKRLRAEAVLKSLGMKPEELGRDLFAGVHQSSFGGETVCIVDSLGQVYVVKSDHLAIHGSRSSV